MSMVVNDDRRKKNSGKFYLSTIEQDKRTYFDWLGQLDAPGPDNENGYFVQL